MNLPDYADKLIVTDGTSAMGGFSSAPMSLGTAEELRTVEGVDVVVPVVMMLFDDQMSGVSMGSPT